MIPPTPRQDREVSAAAEPPIPHGRWWGDHLRETRWMLEALRLTVDPVWLGAAGIPRGDGRGVVLMPGFGGGDQTLAVLAALAVADRLLAADLRVRPQHRLRRPGT